MLCMRQDYIPVQTCLGSVPAGTVIMLPGEDSPYLVTNNKRVKQVTGDVVDTVGIVSCDTGSLLWFSDRYDVIPIKDATLVYRLAGRSGTKHD